MALNVISIITAAGKDDMPFSPFVTIRIDTLLDGRPAVESPQLMTAQEIDTYIGRLKDELTEVGKRAKHQLAAAIANDSHRQPRR
jgi:hypothetical protein